jgi:hypothetical protein
MRTERTRLLEKRAGVMPGFPARLRSRLQPRGSGLRGCLEVAEEVAEVVVVVVVVVVVAG